MTDADRIFEEALAHIQELSEKGLPFRGKAHNPDKSAKFRLLKHAASELSESQFVEKVTVSDAPDHRNGQICIDLPAAVSFRADEKGALPAVLNAADTYSFAVKDDGGIRITAIVLDLWRE